ncbi:unnamed protein product [Linum trigynum]|uniref:Uncharacterized protein n=1 Tax=Linum trigynum TaxID=586398 RepID=A0AAV2GW73_9ROSI
MHDKSYKLESILMVVAGIFLHTRRSCPQKEKRKKRTETVVVIIILFKIATVLLERKGREIIILWRM